MLKTFHTINWGMICVIVVLLLSCRRVPSTQITHATQINLHQSSVFAAEKLKQNQLTSGNWTTFFNIDTVPSFSAWVFDAVYTGMIMVDLLRPLSSIYNLDTTILRSWKYVSSQVDPETGLLRFFNLFKDMPEDADDTGLYWWLAANADTTILLNVLDALAKNRNDNGLYYTWFRPGGLQKHLGHGDNPNPNDCMANIHVYLLLSKYAPDRAQELHESFVENNIISDPEYWVYNKWSPWLYYLREADLIRSGFELDERTLDEKVHSVKGQHVYADMTKLIRDFSLSGCDAEQLNYTKQILAQLSGNEFEYFEKNPVLLYHNDLTFAVPRYFWSKDVAYALWLRLYYEYNKTLGEN